MNQREKSVLRRTSFATISVREYEQTIGDSPSCHDGAPVALGWRFQESLELSLDEYEQARLPFRRRRSDLLLGVQQRRKKLVDSGVALLDVLRAENLVSLKKTASGKEPRRTPDLKLQQKGKPSNQCRLSPPLQKQMASRAA
ncbi:hypothetical protein HJC23_005773 [Cyclotella cryptica]|uniref:Uncharacterized protein n=1 Tax=Cyclotella cryptica TaxID=29204 RepID=A0ABD3NVV5_9STRA|eukprot:CCRYP_019413-RA/>CCRYP_019413-RA protein AED:0.04 eAED:0.03 QI:0/-1/0/1/-1/1/1/0/141